MFYGAKGAGWSYQDFVDRGSIQPVTEGGQHAQNHGAQQVRHAYKFIESHNDEFNLSTMCPVCSVELSGY